MEKRSKDLLRNLIAELRRTLLGTWDEVGIPVRGDLDRELERMGVAPNGTGGDLMQLWGRRKAAEDPFVFFQANFSWLQNVEAADNLVNKVFPQIIKRVPKAVCCIFGQEAKDKVGENKDKLGMLKGENEKVLGVEKDNSSASSSNYTPILIILGLGLLGLGIYLRRKK